MVEYQGQEAPESPYFQSGRSKVNDIFPNIGFEPRTRSEEWAATSHGKDIKIEIDIFIGVKALVGPKPTLIGEQNPIEDYISDMSDLCMEILNEPGTLQYDILNGLDGQPLVEPIRIYDSMCSRVQFSNPYNGALWMAQLSWWGKYLRLGTSIGGGGYTPGPVLQS